MLSCALDFSTASEPKNDRPSTPANRGTVPVDPPPLSSWCIPSRAQSTWARIGIGVSPPGTSGLPVYLLGGEDRSVPQIEGATRVRFPTSHCVNMAVASGLVLFDRKSK